MTSQTERGAAFAALYEREGMFLLPNPWDAGSWRHPAQGLPPARV